ncbi:MAG: adenylate/guanylate cyclase domain-containing protein, partial [Ignavibacteriales bacterium]|nr:adenylate/guanylate cyclase domain-containing protein [Ignavibacteriales bacterium]
KFYPSFPFRAVCDYLSVTPERVVVNPGNSITLKDARRPGQAAHDIVIPVDEQCNLLINFLGPWHAMTHYEFADVHHSLDDRDELEYSWTPLLQGKIVVVSQVGTGAADVAPVPTDNNFPLSGVHANVLNTILTERFLREASPLQMFALEIFLLAVVYLLALKFLSRGMWIGALLVLVGFLAVSALLFFYGNIVLNIVRPSIMIGIAVFAVLAYRFINEEREKEAFRRSFESYLPPSVVKRMVASPESMFDAEKKELTILFSDIKSFTTYSSTMTADRIQSFLAEYFEAMVGIIFKYEGTVDKYIGDGLMVFFGAPAPQADHAVRAAQAAIEMQRKCRELKVKWEREGLFPLRIRIGINTGEVVVGNMGTPKKLAYTVLGAPVNLANRLESNAPVEGILVSKRTYELIQNHVPTKPHPSVKVKGLEEDIEVYEVVVEPAA